MVSSRLRNENTFLHPLPLHITRVFIWERDMLLKSDHGPHHVTFTFPPTRDIEVLRHSPRPNLSYP